jgi:hypothetical protein
MKTDYIFFFLHGLKIWRPKQRPQEYSLSPRISCPFPKYRVFNKSWASPRLLTCGGRLPPFAIPNGQLHQGCEPQNSWQKSRLGRSISPASNVTKFGIYDGLWNKSCFSEHRHGHPSQPEWREGDFRERGLKRRKNYAFLLFDFLYEFSLLPG